MSTPTQTSTITVALTGNPNTGKSTLFSDLVGVHQQVGNYPGVTVEKKTGRMEYGGRRYRVVDLPGIYSLAPRSPDEMVTVDVLLGHTPAVDPIDVVVCIADACNLKRNLYLVSQVLELGLPTVLALNMIDVADDEGIAIDVDRLASQLGIPVVATQANRGRGVDRLKEALSAVAPAAFETETPFPGPFEHEVVRLQSLLAERGIGTSRGQPISRFLVRRLLLDVNGYLQRTLLGDDAELLETLREARDRLAVAECGVPGVEIRVRYAWIGRVLDGVVQTPAEYRTTLTDRVDRVLTHRFWGLALFALVMVVVFQAVFSWAEPLMGAIDGAFQSLGAWIEATMAEGALRSLLVDGVVGGVGGVLVFLPQILILFLFIGVLEDCGYMARAAYLMDRAMVRVGLSGKSFIPLLASCACAVPGIMAARVIENERDRLTTILVAPLMTCSARLPVYALLIAAFIPARTYFGVFGLQGLTLIALYAVGMLAAVTAALVLKRTLLRGQAPPFVMELPRYKWPSPRIVVMRVFERASVFLRTAGTIILAVSILVWAALYYPRDTQSVEALPEIQRLRAELASLPADDPRYEQAEAELDRELSGAYQRQSFLGRAGRWVEPVFRPLGWDWRISCAVIASFPAREVVVATLGVIFDLGEGVDAESEEGASRFRATLERATWGETDRKLFNVPVALSLMVFFALCAQCAATLAVIRRETNSWRWPAFTFAYMTTLAYLAALATYQTGMWIRG